MCSFQQFWVCYWNLLKFYQACAIITGRLDVILNGLLMGSLWGYFRGEARLGRLSTNEMQEATFEDPNHICFESTNFLKNLHDKFETSKERVWGKIKCYVFTSNTFFHCEIFLLWKKFSEYSGSACFENMKNKFVITWVPLLTLMKDCKSINLVLFYLNHIMENR